MNMQNLTDGNSPNEIAEWALNNYGGVWHEVQREAELVATDAITRMGQENEEPGNLFHHPQHTMHATQIAYVMRCFAMIDGLSQAPWGGNLFDRKYREWKGKHADNSKASLPSAQSWRMTAFLNRYLGIRSTAARLAVEMYRHTPMHEGYPHACMDTENCLYMWSLAWNVPKEQHFRISPFRTREELLNYGESEPNCNYMLEVGTLTLIGGLQTAIEKYAFNLTKGGKLCDNYLRLDAERWNARLRWTPNLKDL